MQVCRSGTSGLRCFKYYRIHVVYLGTHSPPQNLHADQADATLCTPSRVSTGLAQGGGGDDGVNRDRNRRAGNSIGNRVGNVNVGWIGGWMDGWRCAPPSRSRNGSLSLSRNRYSVHGMGWMDGEWGMEKASRHRVRRSRNESRFSYGTLLQFSLWN